jgi:DNA repair exonuclease SbcCD ATPase subunit
MSSVADTATALAVIEADEPDAKIWIKTNGFEAPPELIKRADQAGVRITPINLPRPERLGRGVTLPESGQLPTPREALALYNAAQRAPLEGERLARALARFDKLLADCPSLSAPVVAGVGAPTTHWVTATGFGSLPDGFEFDFDSLPDFTAFSGTNGAGKTTVAGLAYAILRGELPGYAGNIYDRLSDGGTGRAEIECGISYRGIHYRAARKLKKTPGGNVSQEAWLYRIDAGNPAGEELIEGPSAVKFKAAINSLFGPPELAEMTAFRGSHGQDLASADRAARRQALADMIGYGPTFTRIADAASKLATGIDKAEKDRAARLSRAVTDEAHEDAIDVATKALVAFVQAQTASERAQESLTAARDALSIANQASPDTAAIVERHALAMKTLDLARTEERNARAALEKIEAAAAKIEGLEADVAILAETRARIETLEADA